MFKCAECGCIFKEPKRWEESRGEFWGQPAYETMYGCPHCYSTDYDEYNEADEYDEEGEEESDDE